MTNSGIPFEEWQHTRQLLLYYRKATRNLGWAMLNFQDVYLEGEDHHDIRMARENVLELLEEWLEITQTLLKELKD